MDDKLLEIIENEVSFLKPYIKQFKKRIKGNKVLVIENSKSNINNLLSDLELEKEDKEINGIIIYELNKETIELLTTKYVTNLDEEGKVLIINSNPEYDLEIVNYLLKDKYELEEEFIGDAKWNFLLYKKNTTQ